MSAASTVELARRTAGERAAVVLADAAAPALGRHAEDCLRVEALRLGDRFERADVDDLLAELRHELAAVAARAGLTAAALAGRPAVRVDVDLGTALDAVVRDVIAAVDLGYEALGAGLASHDQRWPRRQDHDGDPDDAEQRARAASAITGALRDGDWHHAAPIRAELVAAGVGESALRATLRALRVEGRGRGQARSWRLTAPADGLSVAITSRRRRRPSKQQTRAVELLHELLRDGPRPWKDIEQAAAAAGLSLSTITRASAEMGVGRSGRGLWRLPAAERTEAAAS